MAASQVDAWVWSVAAIMALTAVMPGCSRQSRQQPIASAASPPRSTYLPRSAVDSSGYQLMGTIAPRWPAESSLVEIAELWSRAGNARLAALDRVLHGSPVSDEAWIEAALEKSALLNFEGQPEDAYSTLSRLRTRLERNDELARQWLMTLVFLQGVTAMRLGENENCILCRGESSCIVPIAPTAVHVNPRGSHMAAQHFREYLAEFPDDVGVRWLLNLAHMTLGEHPRQVDPQFLLTPNYGDDPNDAIGAFRDIGEVTGVNRLNLAGGAILDDFDNDGYLDLVTTSVDPAQSMAVLLNTGQGKFVDRTEVAGVSAQLGGLYCVQCDYNDDGMLDIYIPRGAWVAAPVRPSLLRNNGDGTFSDVTEDAGLLDPVNSNSASWGDYDNDGYLDLYVCCERQRNRLFRNSGDGTFQELANELSASGSRDPFCKGASWIDFDNDDDVDLFLSYFGGTTRLLRNERGIFEDVTAELGIDGPRAGFSCWAWDYDNDGWLDLLATCYEQTLDEIVKGLLRHPHQLKDSNRLYRNVQGKRFENATSPAGLDLVLATMGSNFADFDNDGYLDMYLGTGDPKLETLVPNRMFRNLSGQRFVDITGSSRTGHLQKGHGVACGDWDRDGDNDLFVELGGVANGDRFHNVLFQNPGSSNVSLTLRLIGRPSNRFGVGARVKIVTAGDVPMTIHRHISSGSSFGANPLEQTIGLGPARRIALLEVHWPASHTTQTFRDIEVNQVLVIREFDKDYTPLSLPAIPQPNQ